MFNLIGLLIVGLIIGALARLIKPGRQRLSLLGAAEGMSSKSRSRA